MISQDQDLSQGINPNQDSKLMLKGFITERGNNPGKLADEVSKLDLDELKVFCAHLDKLKRISLQNILAS